MEAENKIAIYMPHASDLALKVDLGGYRCQAFDLAQRRPVVPDVEAGDSSTVRLSVCKGDVLFVAIRDRP